MEKDIESALSPSTQKQYKMYLNVFKQFLLSRFNTNFRRVTEEHVELFVTYLKNVKGLTGTTISCYLAAIAFYSKLHHKSDPTKSFGVKLLLRAYAKHPHTPLTRKPINKVLLRQLCAHVLSSNLFSNYFKQLYYIVYTLMYKAALRISEVCLTDSPQHILKYSNVKFLHKKSKLIIKLDSFKHSKNCDIPYISITCSLEFKRALTNYLFLRGSGPGPFICNKSLEPIPRSDIVHQLKSDLNDLGYNSDLYNTHSFRIGRATDMHLAGATDSQIAAMGRWHSTAYKKYIRPTVLHA